MNQTAPLDADGKPIIEGVVLHHLSDGARGVVVGVARPGEKPKYALSAPGDIGILTAPGCTRVTNMHARWRRIPREEQTYAERRIAWMHTPYDHDESRPACKAEGAAIDGIMALLPTDPVDWSYGPFPDRLEDALYFLEQHLTELHKAANPPT